MKYALPATIALVLAGPVQGCASHVAQGYRSTPDYPAYAAATCTRVALDQALIEAAEDYVERRTGTDVTGLGPGENDLFGGLLMVVVFALAEERPMNAADACAGVAAAQASADRRRGY